MDTVRIRASALIPFVGIVLWAASFAAEHPAPDAFTFDTVTDIARSLAKTAYRPPDSPDPSLLDKKRWDKIAFRKEALLWNAPDSPFAVGFYHNGFIFDQTVAVNCIEDGKPAPIPFAPGNFVYPDDATAAAAGAGFAGFFINAVAGFAGEDPELASFLGRSFFRARARRSDYGIYARGLAIDTALPDGEELPFFREFWLEKPRPGDSALTVHALMDSPRVTGAFRFLVAPGASAVMHVRARLFGRDGAGTPAKIGLAPLTSMFLRSETDRPSPHDYRPEVHNSDGLLCVGGDGEWQWRPLLNPPDLKVSGMELENPRGFGLVQRDDDFGHYQDLDGRFERRPSLWVEPLGKWGAGHVELIEIPATADHQGNIVAFWVSDPPADGNPAAGEKETPPSSPRLVGDVEYRLHWMAAGASPHNLGRAAATRTQKNADGTTTFVVDFEGGRLDSLDAETGLVSLVEIPGHFAVAEKVLRKNPITSGWRLVLTVKPPPEKGILDDLFPSRDSHGPTRFRALLKLGENLPDPLTETWVFEPPP